jgi:hypothetical protein
MAAMTDAKSGLPADILNADGSTSVQTSTTNIGAYMWSTLVAERLGLIGHAETVTRLQTTVGTPSTWSASSRAASSTTGTTTAPGRS